MLQIFLSLYIALCFQAFADSKESFVGGDSAYTEAEVDKLKDSIVNTQLQLKMFQEILEKEGIERSYPEVRISFNNSLSNRYRIYSVEYILDGVRTYYYQMQDDAIKRNTASKEVVQDYSANLSPGSHTLQVIVNFLGNDKGIFSYLSEYKVQMEDKKDLKLKKNTNYVINVKTYEKGGLLADFKEKAKLEIAFQEVSK